MREELLMKKFNDYITNHDLDGLGTLLSDDHIFIDAAGNVIKGKDEVLDSWKSFFYFVPDYTNVFDKIVTKDRLAIATGRSVCSKPELSGPAIWVAYVKEGKITEWRVLDDTLENRREFMTDALT